MTILNNENKLHLQLANIWESNYKTPVTEKYYIVGIYSVQKRNVAIEL